MQNYHTIGTHRNPYLSQCHFLVNQLLLGQLLISQLLVSQLLDLSEIKSAIMIIRSKKLHSQAKTQQQGLGLQPQGQHQET